MIPFWNQHTQPCIIKLEKGRNCNFLKIINFYSHPLYVPQLTLCLGGKSLTWSDSGADAQRAAMWPRLTLVSAATSSCWDYFSNNLYSNVILTSVQKLGWRTVSPPPAPRPVTVTRQHQKCENAESIECVFSWPGLSITIVRWRLQTRCLCVLPLFVCLPAAAGECSH